MQVYATRAPDTELLREATEIKVKAERIVGQMLITMATVGERGLGRPKKEYPRDTLSDLQITRVQSSRWQRLAKLDDKAFAQKLDRTVRKAIAAASGAGKLERKSAHGSSAGSGGSEPFYDLTRPRSSGRYV